MWKLRPFVDNPKSHRISLNLQHLDVFQSSLCTCTTLVLSHGPLWASSASSSLPGSTWVVWPYVLRRTQPEGIQVTKWTLFSVVNWAVFVASLKARVLLAVSAMSGEAAKIANYCICSLLSHSLGKKCSYRVYIDYPWFSRYKTLKIWWNLAKSQLLVATPQLLDPHWLEMRYDFDSWSSSTMLTGVPDSVQPPMHSMCKNLKSTWDEM